MLQPMYFWKDLEKIYPKMYGFVALIVNRFRDNRQKHQHRRLNSYRGDSRSFCSLENSKVPGIEPALPYSTDLKNFVLQIYSKNSFIVRRKSPITDLLYLRYAVLSQKSNIFGLAAKAPMEFVIGN